MSAAAPLATRPPATPIRPVAAAPAAVQAGGFDLVSYVRHAPTPVRLKALLYAVWAAAAVLFLVGEGALAEARLAIKAVGKDSAPSIIAAQKINSSLADLDASAGNYLLGSKAHQAAATEAFERRRTEVTTELVEAARLITYGDEERVPITTMLDGLGRYLELVAETRYRKDIGDGAGAVRTYEAASDLMHQRLLPAADQLDAANRGHLDREYRRQEDQSGLAAFGAGAVGALLVAALVWAQIFVLRRMRRILTPALLGATVVAIVYTIFLVTRITVAREDLKIAKEDAFESIHALYKARTIAYDANGDESRYLLGDGRGATFEEAYKKKTQALTSAPLVEASALERRAYPSGFSGLFADELRNITFPGEREAADRMVLAFGAYARIDDQIRTLERAGKHDRAVDLCIGAGSDQSNAAFDRFDRALIEVIDLNRREFDATVEQGTSALGVATALGPIASLLVALLALFGLRPRLREYAA